MLVAQRIAVAVDVMAVDATVVEVARVDVNGVAPDFCGS
jgi:hypothetical protein